MLFKTVPNSAPPSKIEVFVRLRPLEPDSESCLFESPSPSPSDTPSDAPSVPPSRVRLSKDRQTVHDFAFDSVFSPASTQREVFDAIGRPFVDRLLAIPNDQSVLFAFGTSSSGKTFTVQGKLGDGKTKGEGAQENEARKRTEARGVLPRVLESLFASIPKEMLVDYQQTDEMDLSKDLNDIYIFAIPSSMNTKKIKISISFYEIYNEKITDLLSPPNTSNANNTNTYLTLQDDPNGNVQVKDLNEVVVTDIDAALKYLEVGLKNRAVQATKINPDSSRSHSVFDIKLTFYDSNNCIESESKLSIVDLAGSERLSKTQNTGERTREASNINKSLMILGRCIEILRRNQSNPKSTEKVPYRDSKLTHIFRDCLSGVQGKVSMVITINPKMMLFEENIHVLKFAAIAKTVNVETAKKVTKTVRFEKDNNPPANTTLNVGLKMDVPSVRRPFRHTQTQKPSSENAECVIPDSQVEMWENKMKQFEMAVMDNERRMAQKESEIRTEVANAMHQQMQENERILQNNFQQRMDTLETYYKRQMASLQDGLQKRMHELEQTLNQKEETIQKQQQTINNLKLTISKMKPAKETTTTKAPTPITTTIRNTTAPLKEIPEPSNINKNQLNQIQNQNIGLGISAQPVKKILTPSSVLLAQELCVAPENSPAFTPIAKRSQRRNEKNG